MLCPSTVLYRHFLKHCTLTNQVVGTIWRDLSKPQVVGTIWRDLSKPQRRGGPNFRPLWLIVGTPPSAIRPELAFRWAEPYSDVPIFIFNINIYYLCCLCIDFHDLSAKLLLVCCPFKEADLQLFKCVSFWFHGCCGEWEGWDRKPVHHISWMAVLIRSTIAV